MICRSCGNTSDLIFCDDCKINHSAELERYEKKLDRIANDKLIEYMRIGGPVNKEMTKGENIDGKIIYTMILRDCYLIYYPYPTNKRPEHVNAGIIDEVTVMLDYQSGKILKVKHDDLDSFVKRFTKNKIPVYIDSYGYWFITSDYKERAAFLLECINTSAENVSLADVSITEG